MTLLEVKQAFFAGRNGITADALRKGGIPHSVIYGLNVPQLAAIAAQVGVDPGLGAELWNDRNVRESRLLALWLIPREEMTPEQALSMATDVKSREEADMLAFRILRHLPYSRDLAAELSELSPSNPAAAMSCESLSRFL